VPVLTQAELQAVQAMGQGIGEALQQVSGSQEELVRTISAFGERFGVALAPGAATAALRAELANGAAPAVATGQVVRELVEAERDAAAPIIPAPAPAPDGAPRLKAGARVMLVRLGQLHPRALTLRELSVLSGFPQRERTFSNYLGALRGAGLVEADAKDEGLLALTGPGLSLAHVEFGALALRQPHVPEAAPPSTKYLEGLWAPKLKLGARAMLSALVEMSPAGLTRAELAQRAKAHGAQVDLSPAGRTFSNYLGALKSLGLAEERGGHVYACDALFPERLTAEVRHVG
jgi:hypothetical protein